MSAALVRGEDGGLHVRQFANPEDAASACAAHETKWPVMTPEECDRLLRRARARRTERAARASWVAHHLALHSAQHPLPVEETIRKSVPSHFVNPDSHTPRLVRGIQF